MPYNKTASLKEPGEVFCLGLIRRVVEGGNDWAITAGLAALKAVPGLQRSVCYTDFVLQPWINAVAASGVRNQRILVRALEAQNPFKVIERAHAALDRSVPQATRARDALRRLIAASAEAA